MHRPTRPRGLTPCRAIWARLALLVAAAWSLSVSPALAGAKLDQHNLVPPDPGGFAFSLGLRRIDGQTFTAGQTGVLQRVAVFLERDFGQPVSAGTVFLEIYPTTAADAPQMDRPPLGSGSLPIAALTEPQAFVNFRLTQPTPVVKGARYAIILHADVPLDDLAVLWDGSTAGDRYVRGGNAQRADDASPWTVVPQQDHYFQTFVAVPRQRHRAARPASARTPDGAGPRGVGERAA